MKIKYGLNLEFCLPFSVLRSKIVKVTMLSSKRLSLFEVFTDFSESQIYVCSLPTGIWGKIFSYERSQGCNEYSLKKPTAANGYFFVFPFGPLCT